jgi:kinesin family protein 16B
VTTQETEEEKRMTEQLQKSEAQVQHLTTQWNNKWKETHKIMEEKALAFRREGFGIKMESDFPHSICIDDDILSTGVTLYHLTEGRTHVGREDALVKQDIVLRGPGIEAEHCILESIEGSVTLQPIAEECYVNGNLLKKSVRLSQGAVILLGKTNMFRFNHPGEAAKLRQKYASVGNLASVVPTNKEMEEPSYLFYNAGMEMERPYRQEAQDLDSKRKEIERLQEEDARKLDDARKELDQLQDERRAEEEKQRKELDDTQQHLQEQKMQLYKLKEEQERARENAQRELQLLKERIKQEQEEIFSNISKIHKKGEDVLIKLKKNYVFHLNL